MEIALTDIDTPAFRELIEGQLNAHSSAALGLAADKRVLAVLLRDEEGGVVGGMWGKLRFRWLQIDHAVVPAQLRGQGVGTAMLGAMEREAVRLGAIGVRTRGFSFQSPDFYRARGYTEYARLDGHPPGHHEVALYKTAGLGAGDDGRAVELAGDPADGETLRSLLAGHNAEEAGPAEQHHLGVTLRDAHDAAPVGGLVGNTSRDWLHVELFSLPADLRGGGWGTRIMRMALDEARARGAAGAKLTTGSYQARPFYERLGFRVYGEIADYLPGGHARFLMAQRFDR